MSKMMNEEKRGSVFSRLIVFSSADALESFSKFRHEKKCQLPTRRHFQAAPSFPGKQCYCDCFLIHP